MRMQDANMAATEITDQGELSRPTYRRICSRLLFQDGRGGIESSPKAVRRVAMISPTSRPAGTPEWRRWRHGFCDGHASAPARDWCKMGSVKEVCGSSRSVSA